MKTWIAIIATVALGIAISRVTGGANERPGPSQLGDAHTAAAPSAAEGARLVARPTLLTPRVPVEILQGERVPESPGSGSTKPAYSSEEVRDRIEVFFSSEAVDPAWNREAAETLTKGVQAVLPAGSSLRRIECRGTLCRVETSHVDVDGFRAFAQHAFLDRETRVGSSGFFASLLGEPAPGGAVTAVAYLAREGKELPGPEALFAPP